MVSPEAYAEPCQTSKMAIFAKLVNALLALLIFAECRMDSEYAFAVQQRYSYIYYFEIFFTDLFLGRDLLISF